MQVAMDGLVFESQAQGGISRIFRTILPIMCELDPQLAISLYLLRQPKQMPVPHSRIHSKRLLSLVFRGLALTGMPPQKRRNLALSLGVYAKKGAVWHSTYYSQPLYWNGPKVLSFYDLIYFLYPQYFPSQSDDAVRQAMAGSAKAADVILCISATTAQDVADRFKIASDRIKVIHLAASPVFRPLRDDLPEKSTKETLPTKKPFLLYIGSRSRYKNFQFFLAGYARWQYRNEVDLVVVGAPLSPSEMTEDTVLQVIDKIYIRTNIDDEQLNLLYNHALAFVYPSLYEGFGVPLLEAMSVGCPIVASDISSSREIARDYPIYFDPVDGDSLVAALDRAWLAKPESAHVQYGQNIAAEFSWEQTAYKTLQQYYDVSGLSSPSSMRSPNSKIVTSG